MEFSKTVKIIRKQLYLKVFIYFNREMRYVFDIVASRLYKQRKHRRSVQHYPLCFRVNYGFPNAKCWPYFTTVGPFRKVVSSNPPIERNSIAHKTSCGGQQPDWQRSHA